MTASGVTHPWRNAKEAGPNRLGELFTDFHFGVVDIDWDAATVQLALKDIQGAVQRSQSIAFNELKVTT
jgi:alkaline phosphatase D